MYARPNPYSVIPALPEMNITSTDVMNGAVLGVDQQNGMSGGPGRDISPQLVWSGHPASTKSFVVTCFDADAPTVSGYWHWLVYDIPGDVTELVRDAGSADGSLLPPGAKMLKNDAGLRQFIGAGPPPGSGPHRYYFAVHALDLDTLDMSGDETPGSLGATLCFNATARGVIFGTFENP